MATQAIPTWDYIEEELTSRGWTRFDLAERMGGDPSVNLCAMDFLETVPWRLSLGDVAQRLATAFGTSAELWTNIHDSYRQAHKSQEEATAPAPERTET